MLMNGLAETDRRDEHTLMRRSAYSWLSWVTALLLAFALSSKAERGSHIRLEEPLPQPAWELPLIANGEGTVSNESFLG